MGEYGGGVKVCLWGPEGFREYGRHDEFDLDFEGAGEGREGGDGVESFLNALMLCAGSDGFGEAEVGTKVANVVDDWDVVARVLECGRPFP